MPSLRKKNIKKILVSLKIFPILCLMIIICTLRSSQELEDTFLHEDAKFDTNTKLLPFLTLCQNAQALPDARGLSCKTN